MTLKLALIALLYFSISLIMEVGAGTLPKSYHEGLTKKKVDVDKSVDRTYDGFAYTDPSSNIVLNTTEVASRVPCGASNQYGLFANTNPPATSNEKEDSDKIDEIKLRHPANKEEAQFEEEETPLYRLPPEKWVTYYPCEKY